MSDTVEVLKGHLASLYEIREQYQELGTDCMLDEDLLDICRSVTELTDAPKLDRLWRDYEEYYLEAGSESMTFGDVLYNAISHLKTVLESH